MVQGVGLCGGVGEISWVPQVKGESHPKLQVSLAVSIVKSRQVSEVKKKKFNECIMRSFRSFMVPFGIQILSVSFL